MILSVTAETLKRRSDRWLILWLLHELWAPVATLWVLFGWTPPTALSWWRTRRLNATAE